MISRKRSRQRPFFYFRKYRFTILLPSSSHTSGTPMGMPSPPTLRQKLWALFEETLI